MKKILLIVLVMLSATSGLAINVVKIEAKIYSVDVYPSGAKLYIKGEAKLKKGQNRIEIGSLPTHVFDQTLRVGVPTSGVVIHSSLFEENQTDLELSDEVVGIQTQIQALQRAVKQDEIKVTTIDEQLAVLKTQCSVVEGHPKPSLDYLSGVIDMLGDKMNKLLSNKLEILSKIEVSNEQVKALLKQKTDYKNKMANLSRVMVIVAQCNEDKTASIGAEFVIASADWEPYYEVRIENGKCEVVTKARVKQRCQLDWNDAQLNLISSDLQHNSMQLPELNTTYVPVVKFNQANDRSFLRSSQASVAEMQMDVQYSAPPMAMAGISYNMKNFRTTTTYSVASGSSVDIKLVSQSVPVALEYLIIPSESNLAYLVANLTTQASAFDQGVANIYLDGTFIGTQSLGGAQLAENGAGVVVKISLGADNGIIFNTTGHPSVKGNIELFDRTTVIVNNKDRAVAVKVVEGFPISTDSAVKVEDLRYSDGATKDNMSGVINWVFELQPQQTVERSISYSVKDGRKVR